VIVDEFQPDVVLVADEVQLRTPAPVYLRWLEITLDIVRTAPIIALAHTVSCTPFGPSSFFSSEHETERCRSLLTRASAVITPSRFAADYLQRYGGVPAVALRWPVADGGSYRDLSGLAKGTVGVINPCAMKGIDILVGLATEMPSVRFHARLSWATTAADRRRLESLSNVVVAPYAHQFEAIYEPLAVLLVPSVCYETLALVPIEAMVHGIPTISSDLGGLPEAMLGRPQLCPVTPIERWDYDAARGAFSPVVPAQDLEPWKCAIQSFLGSDDHYRELSAKGREAALDYIRSGPFEEFESRVFELAGL
jgi:glycosyltransferase involved in cell wall biosynthesis